jgi:hypothetical protein
MRNLWIRCWRAAFGRRLAKPFSDAIAWSLGASRAMVRPGLLIVLLIAMAPLYILAIQPELHASSNNKGPDGSTTFSVVNVTPCVTTAQGAELECPVSYTAGDSLVLNVSLDTGSDTFFTPSP